MAKKIDNDISYEEAFFELEAINTALQRDEVGIDELTLKLKRANELIKICREQLKKTERETNKILELFEE